MHVFQFTYDHAIYTRVSTFGGLDSDSGEPIVVRDQFTIVVPDPSWAHIAELRLRSRGGNKSDSMFRIIDKKDFPLNELITQSVR